MSTYNLSNIEKNKKFKSYILNKNIWKNYAFIPPALVLFTGLLGLVYLYKNEIIISWYSIPFIIVFALGTIWFKATKKYLLNKKINETESFLVCATSVLFTKGSKSIVLFTTNKNRHNQNYIEKQKDEILGKIDFSKELILDKVKKHKFTSIKNNDLYATLTSNNQKKSPIAIIDDQLLVAVKASQLSKFGK